jgi:hypothetical protein
MGLTRESCSKLHQLEKLGIIFGGFPRPLWEFPARGL